MIALGRRLFFDAGLSINGEVSCAIWLEEHARRSERILTAKELAEKKFTEKERGYFYSSRRDIH